MNRRVAGEGGQPVGESTQRETPIPSGASEPSKVPHDGGVEVSDDGMQWLERQSTFWSQRLEALQQELQRPS